MEPITTKSSIDLNTYYRVVLGFVLNIKVLIIFFVLVVLLSVRSFWEHSVNSLEAWEGLAFPLLFVVVFLVTLWIACKKSMKKNPLLLEDSVYQIDNNTIAYLTKSVSASIGWQHIKKVKETGTHYLLFTSFNAFLFLSKDGFESSTEIERFKEMVIYNKVKANFKA